MEPKKVQRARPFHRPGRIFVVLLLDLLLLALLAACGYCLYQLFGLENKDFGKPFIALLGVLVFLFVIRRLYESKISCPLCHGPVLQNRRCLKHRKAHRIFFLTHRATAILDILTGLRFTCMYCGTRFRTRR